MKLKVKNLQNKDCYLDLSQRIDWRGGSLSKFQQNVKRFFEPYWSRHIVVEELPIPGTRLRIDIANFTLRLFIEIDGGQHIRYIPGKFHRSMEDFDRQLMRDSLKEQFARKNNFKLIRIFEDDMPLTVEKCRTLGLNL